MGIDLLDAVTLSVTYKARGSLELPIYPGNLWRGVLGAALRRICCSLPDMECRHCYLRNDCIYCLCYGINPDVKIQGRTPPRPFVLHLPWNSATLRLEPGQQLGFSITLFGETLISRLPYLAEAFHLLGERGLGKRRVPLEMVTVSPRPAQPVIHLQAGTRSPKTALMGKPEAAKESGPGEVHPQDLEVYCITPLILENHDKRLDRGLPLAELVRASWRRKRDLLAAFGRCRDHESWPCPDNGEQWIALADTVAITSDETFWQDLVRFSSRERRRQSQSGLRGRVAYRDVPPELVAWLRDATLLHLGKGTAMGLGAMAMRTGNTWLVPPCWESVNDR